MIRILIRKELLRHLRTLRLVVALLFTVVLCLLTTLMGSLDYSNNMRAYESELQRQSRDREEAVTYRQLDGDIFVPPQPLQILCRGVVQGAGQHFDISESDYHLGAGRVGASSHDDLMNTLTRVDFVGVVSLVLSFLAVVLGFDAICGEREQGTLRLLLAHSVSRGQIIAAKLLGGFLSVWASLALAFVASLVLMQANPDVDFRGDDWVRLALLFLLTCLFLAEVFTLSVLVSAYARRASTSLIICLFGWLVLGAGYTNALPMVARYTLDWPPWQQYVDNADAEYRQLRRETDEWIRKNPRPGDAWMASYDTDGVRRYMHPKGHDWLGRREQYGFERRVELADRVERHRFQNQQPLADQQFFVDRWAVLSPFTGYQVMSKWLTRATLDDQFEVSRYGFRYRLGYLEFLRQKMAADGWRRWYSDDPADAPPMIPDPESVSEEMLDEASDFWRARVAWAKARLDQNPRRKLDIEGLPAIGSGWRRSLMESFERMMPGLVITILSLGLAVQLTVRRFSKYELM